MSASFTIATRDFKSFFGTPLGWISACIIFLVLGIVFFIVVGNLLMRGQSVDPVGDIFEPLLGVFNYISIFLRNLSPCGIGSYFDRKHCLWKIFRGHVLFWRHWIFTLTLSSFCGDLYRT
jgi:hypothetical protein